jgi:hypothetical protein
MGQIDRIPPVSPALIIQTQASSGVEMRKEGRSQSGEQPKRDTVELHDSEISEEEVVLDTSETIDLFPEHGLDLSA